jgi:hypothetical protein
MAKKFIIIIVLIIVVVALIPLILSKMASTAFENPDDPSSQKWLKKAITFERWLFLDGKARRNAEKAIIYFPESNYYDFYLYSAATCAQSCRDPEVAIYWYERFIERFPDHKWTSEAQTSLNKLKALNE